MASPPPRRSDSPASHSATYWQTMRYFSLYRLIIAAILFATFYFLQHRPGWEENYDGALYSRVMLGYLAFGIAMATLAELRWPRFNRQLTLQVTGDVLSITLLMIASGGIKSGLGLLLVVAIAGASLISQGRLALFYAALATIAILLVQTWQMVVWQEHAADYSYAVMLGLSCFATAWLAHSLARRTRRSEALASRRGVDLENLSQINQLIIRDMPDGVLVVDGELRLRHHNARAQELLGGAGQIWKGLRLAQCAPEVATAFEAWRAPAGEPPVAGSPQEVPGKNLRLRFFPLSTAPQQGAVIFLEDWGQVQAQARQMKLAALGRLTANIAHEIRNPLSAISHASQLLHEEDALPAGSARLLQIVDDNVARLDHIVRDVLQLNQRDRVQHEPLALGPFLQEFCEQFCQFEKLAADALALHLPAAPCVVLMDRRHLHQILWNLCRNGWRHGRGEAGSVQLRVLRGSARFPVWLEVADDGAGLPPEVRTRLFEPFFTTDANGTGLGLYVARELCEANGAQLDCLEAAAGGQFRISMKGNYE